jgi:hypothetical protein
MSYRDPDAKPSMLDEWLEKSPADRFEDAQPLFMLVGCVGLFFIALFLFAVAATWR